MFDTRTMIGAGILTIATIAGGTSAYTQSANVQEAQQKGESNVSNKVASVMGAEGKEGATVDRKLK